MSFPVRVPRDAVARKPAYGQPCNRCGVCCMALRCALSERVFGPGPGPCPALGEGDGVNRVCGLIDATKIDYPEMSKAAALIISAGDGCCARINGEPDDPVFRKRLDDLDRERADEIAAARKLWGMA